MILLDASLAYLVRAGRIALETAKSYSMRPESLDRMIQNGNSVAGSEPAD